MIETLKSLALFLQKNGTISEAKQINYLMNKYADNKVENLENLKDDEDQDFLVKSAIEEYVYELQETHGNKDVVGYDDGQPVYLKDIIDIIMKED